MPKGGGGSLSRLCEMSAIWLPGRTTAFLLGLVAVVTALNLAKGLVDPDGFWHLAAGRLIAERGVPTTDPFTFTWGGQPWTAHEWLTELVMHRLDEGIGRTGLTLVWSLFPALTFALLVVALRRAGLALAAIAPVVVLCSLVLTTYVTLRPQAVSWLLLAALLWVLIEIRPRHAPWLLAFGPAFVLWANLHGLYVAGLGVLAVYVAFTLAGRTPLAPRRWWTAAGLLAAFLGTLITPAGLAGLVYPLRYLEAGDWGLGYIPEWNTPNFHEPAHLLLLALIVAVGLSGFRGAPGWLALLAVVSIPASLLAMRSAPIAAVLAAPVLAYAVQDRLGRRGRASAGAAGPPAAHRLLDLVAAGLIAAVAVVTLVPGDLAASIQGEVERRFPVQSADWLEARQPTARVFAEYSWGGYVVYRLHERGGSNFIDGRNDMFDQSILDDYSLIRAADPDWNERLDEYGATAILLTPDAPLTRGPAVEAGWCEAFRSELEVLLLREGCQDAAS
jgi:hypothetical protein